MRWAAFSFSLPESLPGIGQCLESLGVPWQVWLMSPRVIQGDINGLGVAPRLSECSGFIDEAVRSDRPDLLYVLEADGEVRGARKVEDLATQPSKASFP